MAEMLRAPTEGTTYSANSFLEEFADELALISYPLDYDDNLACDIESDIREIEFLLYQGEDSDFKDSIDQSVLTHYDDLFVDPTPEMFTDEQPPDYSFPPRFDVDDDLPSIDNEDKVFNLGILSHEKSVKIIARFTQEKKLALSFASLLFEDFAPPFYELLVFKEVLNPMRLLPFSSENEEKVFKPGIYTFEKFHCYFLTELSHPVNQQTSVVTTAMTAILKQFQSNPPPAQVKDVEEICVTCEGAHPYYQCHAAGGNTFSEYQDNIQGYVSVAAGNYNQATQSNQNFHLNELEKIKRMNDVSLKAMQNQIDMVKNELKNEMKTSIQTSLSNQTNEIKNMMASLLQMNTASTLGSGTLPGNTITNPKGELKAITTRSGLVTKGPTIHNPPKFVNPEEDECVEETYTDPDHAEYTIKVPPPPPVQKPKPPIQRNFVLHTRDSLPPHIPYPSRMLKQKQQEKDDIQIQKFWNMFKQLHLNITLVEALKKLGLPDLIPTLMTLELANRTICTPDGIARDVFVPVGKFTFLANFVVVDYESDPRVPLILGRPFLRTARSLIDIHGEEMILRDRNERLTLNMKHDTTSYSNHPCRELVNLINIFNLSKIASPEVIHEIHDSKGCNFLSEELPDIDSFNDIHSHFDDDPLSGSTTYLANSLLEEFADELALISYPLDYDDNCVCDIESDIREIEFLLYQGEDSDFKDSIDQSVLTHYDDLFVDPTPEILLQINTTDPDHAEYNIKVPPPPPVQKPKPLIQRNFVIHTRDSLPSSVILKKLPEKLRDPAKFLIPCGFSKLKCKALADLGASINLMSLSVWKKLGLLDLIPTQMTLELANRAICTPDGIARDVFVPVGRPFLRTARTLIDVHGEEMILCDGDERLTLNMKHDTTSYSNHPYRESVNLINIFNLSSEDCLKDLVSNKQSGNPTFSLHKEIASPEVINEFHDSKGCTFLSEELPDTDSFNDIHPHFDDDPLSGSTTFSANSLLEEFADELALISYPPDYDDNRACDIKSDIIEIEFLLYQGEDSIDQSVLTHCDDLFVDPIPEMDDVLFSPDNEDKVFNSGILSHEKSVLIITQVTQEKKLAVSFASWLFEDFDPPFYELLVFKEVPNSMRLLPFSSKNEEKIFKPGIYTSKKFHCCFLPELSHPVVQYSQIYEDSRQWILSSNLHYLLCLTWESRSGTLPGNTIANPKGELKAITTRSRLVTEGPTVPNPSKPVNPEEDECVEETYTDPDHMEYNIKVPPPPPVQKPKPPIQRNFVIHTRDSLSSHDSGTCNRAICTPDRIARDVFVPVGKFTFLADFVVVDYESDPRVPLILGRPFLRTSRALIDVHGEEIILRDGDERLTLNMKHDTTSYSNHPYRESVNLISIFNLSSEDCLKDLVSHKQSGNLTFSLHNEIASPEVIPEFHDLKGCTFLSEELPDIDSFNDIHPYFDDDPLSGSTTYSANSLLEEFADELALISYPPDYDDYRACDIESDIREIEFLLFQGEDFDFKDSIDQSVLTHRDDLFVDP
nr:hypothetical protein [Tanacetum cinerariifolium]